MRVALVALALGFCLAGQAASDRLGPAVRRAIPRAFNIDSAAHRDARKELEALVSSCGPGIVEGVRGANRCSFQVKLDELFFEPTWMKTGLLRDADWATRDGVTWLEPTIARDDVPDDFDLRELMKHGEPEIRKQNCGDCWAWSTHHGLEIARAIHDGQPFDLSIQTVLSCSRSGSCGGGYMSAVDFLKHGLPEEDEFPYAGNDKKCKFSSTDIADGWEAKVGGTPFIGSSRDYSLALRRSDGTYRTARGREGNKVRNMMAAMYQWHSPLVVTVSAYSISGPGIYDNCSAINSGGNHMVAISGWDTTNDKRIAHVWNSWGKSHGENGVSRIQWECGDGRLNRGLGYEAKIVQYKSPCTTPDAAQVYLHQGMPNVPVEVGAAQPPNTICTWTPTEGLADPNACQTTAKPTVTTEYHLTAENDCGKSTSMTLVQIWDLALVRTPEGMVRASLPARR